jgi:nucleoside-diphosphate-sugar epimerase
MLIGVTGASGNLGTVAIKRLLHSGEHSVVAFTRRPLRVRHPKITVRHYEAADGLSQAELSGLDCLIHLAYVVEEPKDKCAARHINVDAAAELVAAAADAGVPHVVVASSVNAYGDRYRAGQVIDESAPVRRTPNKFYYDNKAELELRLADWKARNPATDVGLCILRLAYVVGSDIDNSGVRMFRQRPLIYPDPTNAAYQFLHQDDFAEAISLVVNNQKSGTFNVGPPDYVTVTDIARLNGNARVIPVPLRLAERVSDLGFRLGLSAFSSDWVTVGEAAVRSDRFMKTTGWRPQWSCKDAAQVMLKR